jgi:hypothetical protein
MAAELTVLYLEASVCIYIKNTGFALRLFFNKKYMTGDTLVKLYWL